ncbi:MAG: NAD(P)/FAD-dependent oxidoreductase, partial [Sphingomonadaceae bacterium]|nr:NAD(P)/FAD-dependent oxidoreductase [Sphingomonadaceae bacterium]
MSNKAELLKADKATIEDALTHADPMVLRGVLYYLTGDESLTEIEVKPAHMGMGEGYFVTDPAMADDLKRKAADFLQNYRDQGAPPLKPESGRLHKALMLTAGEDIPEGELDMWHEQSALDPFSRTFEWQKKPSASALENFTVAVIGAGLGGLASALSLKRAGITYQVFEKNPEVGGTWFENRYPGARVDSASRVYSHIFGADYVFPYQYSPRDENLKYIQWITEKFGLRDGVNFSTEITSMNWDENAKEWILKGVGPDGQKTWRANAVITSVGFLSRPNLPDIKGMDSFEGTSVHTARWPEDLDHKGKRIAVIGSGASSYQLVPELARTAGHLSLFQRSPSWCLDVPVYLDSGPDQLGWLDHNFPLFSNFMRFRLSWFSAPSALARRMHIDPDFQDPHTRSAGNKMLRDDRVEFIKTKLKGRPDLIERMIPNSPPMATRHVLIDVNYNIYDALMQDNVDLVSDPIDRVTPRGIALKNGTEIEADIIVYATGFKANDFLWPMEVTGKNGKTVDELWAKDGARAYLTTMLPGFPNMFMVYGPNSNNWGGLQILDFEELAIRFSVGCIAGLIAEDKTEVDVAQDAYWRYAAEVDRCEAKMLYSDDRVTT